MFGLAPSADPLLSADDCCGRGPTVWTGGGGRENRARPEKVTPIVRQDPATRRANGAVEDGAFAPSWGGIGLSPTRGGCGPTASDQDQAFLVDPSHFAAGVPCLLYRALRGKGMRERFWVC